MDNRKKKIIVVLVKLCLDLPIHTGSRSSLKQYRQSRPQQQQDQQDQLIKQE